MQRVMIIGQPGSGKSTLARLMGECTGLPVVHIDQIHWKDGWIERTKAEKAALCHEVHTRESWIVEGGHSATWPERLARADTIIWLDISLLRRYLRVTWRTLRYHGRARPDLPAGCPERFSLEFYSWIWGTRNSARAKIQVLLATASPEKRVVVLRSLRDTNAFLKSLEREAATEGRQPS